MAVTRYTVQDNGSLSWATVAPAAGDLIIVLFANDGGDDQSTPTSPQAFQRFDPGNVGSSVEFGAYYRYATGSETGDIVSTTIASAANGFNVNTEEYNAHVFKIPAAEHFGPTSPPELARSNAATGTINPPSLNPAGWGTEDTLWIVAVTRDDDDGISSLTANYSTNFSRTSGSANGPEIASSWRINNAASEDPGNATQTNTNEEYIAFTIGVRPAPTTATITGVTATEFPHDYGPTFTISGLNFGASRGTGTVYLSDAATLAGSANEVDVGENIDSLGNWSDTSIQLSWQDLDAATLLALDTLGPGTRYLIVINDDDEEDSIEVTTHRARPFTKSASDDVDGGDTTTAQLTPPSGKTTGDFGGGRIVDSFGSGTAVDLDEDEYREDEWVIVVKEYAENLDGNTYQFRVVASDGTPLDSYTVVPEVTIASGAEEIEFDVEPASEIDRAADAQMSTEVGMEAESASEVDVAGEAEFYVEQALTVEQASEVDRAFDVEMEAELPEIEFDAEEATEVDRAGEAALTVEPVLTVEGASEIDRAGDVDLTTEPVLTAEEAIEIDRAADVVMAVAQEFAAEPASEADRAADVEMAVDTGMDAENAAEVDRAADAEMSVEPVFVVEGDSEADRAQDVEMAAAPVFVVEQASEVDRAEEADMSPAGGFRIEQAAEVDRAFDVVLAVEPAFDVEVAAEVDRAADVELATTAGFDVEQAAEVDRAYEVEMAVEPVFAAETATEVDRAFDVDMESIGEFRNEQAREIDRAFDVVMGVEQVFVVEPASETDTAADVEMAVEQAFTVEGASEEDRAFEAEMEAVVGITLEPGTEVDRAFDVELSTELVFVVEPGTEVDRAEDVELTGDLPPGVAYPTCEVVAPGVTCQVVAPVKVTVATIEPTVTCEVE